MDSRKVCVIGAGVAGIAAMKGLTQNGVAFDAFDERDRPGGIWAYHDLPGLTSAWDRLNMNSPRGTYEFSDFPMPADWPDFPSRQQCWAYLDAAVDRYGLRPHIRLQSRVGELRRTADGWQVRLASGETAAYRAVVLANGHHNTPRMAAIPGDFAGTVLHSRDYRRREPFDGQRVVVVGYGNSGAQIAVDVSHVAAEVTLVMRSGTYILPHYVRGIRIDRIFRSELVGWGPVAVENLFVGLLHRLLIGRRRAHGIPAPSAGPLSIFPTISESLIDRIGDGRITVRGAIRRLDGKTVEFEDGARIEADILIHATGYHLTFPFLAGGLPGQDDNRLRLYLRTFLPSDPTLSVIGGYQAQAQWGFLPLMEAQGALVGAHLAGRLALPPQPAMEAAADRDAGATSRDFVDTPRHHYQVIGPAFHRQLRRELRRGTRRAARGGA